MFKIIAEPTFTHRVTILVPADNGHREESLTVTFRVLSVEDQAQFNLTRERESDQFLRAIVVKMDDVADEEGKKIPYNDQLRDRILAIPYVRSAVAAAYFTAVNKAQLGN